VLQHTYPQGALIVANDVLRWANRDTAATRQWTTSLSQSRANAMIYKAKSKDLEQGQGFDFQGQELDLQRQGLVQGQGLGLQSQGLENCP